MSALAPAPRPVAVDGVLAVAASVWRPSRAALTDGWRTTTPGWHNWRRRMPAADRGQRCIPRRRGRACLASRYSGGQQSSFVHAYGFAIPVFEKACRHSAHRRARRSPAGGPGGRAAHPTRRLDPVDLAPPLVRDQDQRTGRRPGHRRIARRPRQRPRPGPTHRGGHQLTLDLVLLHRSRPSSRGRTRLRPGGGNRRLPAPHAGRHRRRPGRIPRPAPRRPMDGAGPDAGQQTAGPHFTAPPGSWILGSGTNVPVLYHPAGQYWPLQLILVTVLLALAAAALATGWHATRTRAV